MTSKATAKKRRKPPGSGRQPTGIDGEARTARMRVLRLSESEDADLVARAERAGVTVSDLIRRLLWP